MEGKSKKKKRIMELRDRLREAAEGKSLCLIYWEDITGSSGWHGESEALKKEPMKILSVGWLLKEDRDKVIIASTLSEDVGAADVNVFPTGCIRKIVRIGGKEFLRRMGYGKKRAERKA